MFLMTVLLLKRLLGLSYSPGNFLSEKRAVSGIYGNIWRNHTTNHSL